MKKFIALTIIMGSLTFMGLIIFNSPSLPELKHPNSALNPATKNKVEQITAKAQPQKNSTDELTKKITQELFKETTPSGFKPVDPEKIINEVLKKNIADFDLGIINPEINRANLKVISDNSETAIKNYALNFKKILAHYTPSTRPENYNASLEDLRILLSFYEKSLPELYQLEVPLKIAELHREGLKVFQAQKNVLEKLIDGEKDPIGAILAMELLPVLNVQLTEFLNGKIDQL